MKTGISIFTLLVIIATSGVSVADRNIVRVSTQRAALVIGNAAYEQIPLKNPINDATDLAAKLENLGFDVLLKTDADKRAMIKLINVFGKRLKNVDTGLFYFAGHGMQIDGRNYLIPVGSVVEDESDVEFEAVDTGRLLSKMQVAENKMNIIILDACRNNPFTRSFRSQSQGLAKMDAPTGSIIFYATAPGSVAADGNGHNGLFTKHLLQNIGKTGLTIEQIFKEVRIGVLQETGKRQVPWESSSLTGDFYFNASGVHHTVQTGVHNTPSLPVSFSNDTTQNDTVNLLQQEIKKLREERTQLEQIRQDMSSGRSSPNKEKEETVQQQQVDPEAAMKMVEGIFGGFLKLTQEKKKDKDLNVNHP